MKCAIGFLYVLVIINLNHVIINQFFTSSVLPRVCLYLVMSSAAGVDRLFNTLLEIQAPDQFVLFSRRHLNKIQRVSL